MRALAGLEAGGGRGGDRHSEAAAAWRRFLEALAERHPLVLVFEDLHWADDALLDFVDHLVDWAGGVPMLVVCTARPELLDRRGGVGRRQAKCAHDRPLAARRRRYRAHDRRRCSSRRVLPAETQATLLATAEGNPLYAEEYVRMLIDRGHLRHDGRPLAAGGRGELPVPESVHGLIAARLDDLPADQKQLLQDAAVLGQGRLARRAARDGRREPVRGRGAPARARAPRDAAARAAVVGGRRARVRLPARPRARRRLRPDPARPAGRQAPAGGGMDRVALGRPRERPGHARPPLLAGARVRPRLRVRRPASSSGARGSRSATRPSARAR